MNQNDLFMDSSILYRSTQKYFDRKLQQYQLTYAQLPVLIMIYENEGISMQEIATVGVYDKGTITKNVQKLESMGYVQVFSSLKDKRAKELYTTLKAKEIMNYVYEIRREWWKQLNTSLPVEDIDAFSKMFLTITESAKQLMDQTNKDVKFYAQQKVNLNIYPDTIATVLYTGGCNFQCKYCSHKDLVFLKQDRKELSNEDIKQYLEKRKNTIQAVFIRGGEPCMHENLDVFLEYGKSLGYKMAIQTNGSYPKNLISWIEDGLIDYVVLELKQDQNHYSDVIGLKTYDMTSIQTTVDYLLKSNIDVCFEFMITKEYHTESNVREFAKWIQSDKKCRLRTYDVDREKMEKYLDIVKEYVPNSKIGE